MIKHRTQITVVTTTLAFIDSARKSASGLLFLSAFILTFMALLQSADATSRIKDIADFEGIRENQLVGY
ncbi:MAG: hypothetical protein ABJJ39_02280, partial [Kangiellaceae bacterium]